MHGLTKWAFPCVFQFRWGIINHNYLNTCLLQTVRVFQDSITEQNISLCATSNMSTTTKHQELWLDASSTKFYSSSRYIVTANQLSVNKDFTLTQPLNIKYNYTNECIDFTINASLYYRFSSYAMAPHVLWEAAGISSHESIPRSHKNNQRS